MILYIPICKYPMTTLVVLYVNVYGTMKKRNTMHIRQIVQNTRNCITQYTASISEQLTNLAVRGDNASLLDHTYTRYRLIEQYVSKQI